MISISRLYCATPETGDRVRYGHGDGTPRGPVVVWNTTRHCDLACQHCYADASTENSAPDLSNEEGRALLDDLAAMGSPVILFSGGEPLLRPDIIELITHARTLGLRPVLSTNGLGLTPARVDALREAGLAYAGVSLDGLRETHERFRQRAGSFDAALAGLRAARAGGLKTGLRLTLHKGNHRELPAILDLVEQEQIPRLCIYHLVPTGRGVALDDLLLTPQETRTAVDLLLERARVWHQEENPVEVLTVANATDGPYLLQRLRQEDPARAKQAEHLLARTGGNASGISIGCVSWDGTVYPDQFWRTHPLGNVRERPFSELWQDEKIPLLADLRNRKHKLEGRCARCRWLALCNGNLRARAEALTGRPWASDPGCYLSDGEIGLG